jgi:hypothetical protein
MNIQEVQFAGEIWALAWDRFLWQAALNTVNGLQDVRFLD